MMTNNIILHLCAETGSDSFVWKENGYDVRIINKSIGVENYHPPKKVWGIIANPVCTEFSTARSNGKARNPIEGMFLVSHCQRIISECDSNFWVIENPAKGVLKHFLGDPDAVYEPWHYGSPWTKKQRYGENLLCLLKYIINGRMFQKLKVCIKGRAEASLLSLLCTKVMLDL